MSNVAPLWIKGVGRFRARSQTNNQTKIVPHFNPTVQSSELVSDAQHRVLRQMYLLPSAKKDWLVVLVFPNDPVDPVFHGRKPPFTFSLY
jgi:hypothetical protein